MTIALKGEEGEVSKCLSHRGNRLNEGGRRGRKKEMGEREREESVNTMSWWVVRINE